MNTIQLWDEFTGPEEERARLVGKPVHALARWLDARSIVDFCAAIGKDLETLAGFGYELAANEYDEGFHPALRQRINNIGMEIPITSQDWRSLRLDKRYDLGLCLGNSLTYLPPEEHDAVIGNFAKAAKAVLVDVRNYPMILEGMDLPNKEVYGGSGVHVKVGCRYGQMTRLDYTHEDGSTASLELHAFRPEELAHTMKQHFQHVIRFSNWVPTNRFSRRYNPHTRFFQVLGVNE